MDIQQNGVSVLSTLITIDVGAKTSTTATTPPVISTSALTDDAEITVEITVAGTGAKGLKIWSLGLSEMPQAILNSYSVTPHGPTFLPTDIAGLVRWYKASDYAGTYASGDSIVDPWPDNSVSGQDATPVNNPKYFETKPASGGSTVSMTAAGVQHFTMTALNMSDFSVVAFWRPNADSFAMIGFGLGNYQVRDTTGGVNNVDTPQLRANTPPQLSGLGANNNQVFSVRTWTRNGTTGVPLFYYNKLQETETGGNTNTDAMQLNRIAYDGGSNWDMIELLVYNTVLSQTDVNNLVDGYFDLLYPGDIGA